MKKVKLVILLLFLIGCTCPKNDDVINKSQYCIYSYDNYICCSEITYNQYGVVNLHNCSNGSKHILNAINIQENKQ